MINTVLPVSGQPGDNAVCSAAIRAETDRFLHPACVRGPQPVPFLRGDLQRAACAFELRRGGESVPLEVGRDVLLTPDYLRTKWTTEAPLVFAGYGVPLGATYVVIRRHRFGRVAEERACVGRHCAATSAAEERVNRHV